LRDPFVVRPRIFTWPQMFIWLWRPALLRVLTLAGVMMLGGALGGCDYTFTKQYTGEYEALEGRTIIVYFASNPEELHELCDQVIDSSFFKAGCVGIARNDDERRRMRDQFTLSAEAANTGVDCILIVPTSHGILEHEMGLCATAAEGYPHTKVKAEASSDD